MRRVLPLLAAAVVFSGCAASSETTSSDFVSEKLEGVESIIVFARGNETELEPGSPEFGETARELLRAVWAIHSVERTLTPVREIPALMENSTGWRMHTSEPLAPPKYPDTAVTDFFFLAAAPGAGAADGSVVLCGAASCSHFGTQDFPETRRGGGAG